jgi:hypothetical protein
MVVESQEKVSFKEVLDWLHHAYWIRELLISLGFWSLFLTWIGKHVYVAPDLKWPIIFLLIGISMYALAGIRRWWQKKNKVLSQSHGAEALASNINNATLSAGINIDEFYRLAYRTPLEEEVKNNFRILAHQKQPNDVEGFYLKFIGVGLVQAADDAVWWPMFRSQLLALMEINRNSGMLPLSALKPFYDKAAEEYPKEYASDSFERWFSYLTSNWLVINYASGMVEITVRGKDFLKYLAHWGREPKDKRL